MTNPEFAELLNRRLGLDGSDKVTTNVIRQWVGWDVLPKANPKGRALGQNPVWHRSDIAMRRALRLAELRKLGIRRENALIFQTYVEWGHPHFENVRAALECELAKWTTQLNRRQTTFVGLTKFSEISQNQKKAIANQLGPLDNRLTQFQQSAELYAAIAETARNGVANSEYLAELLTISVNQIAPNLAKRMTTDTISQLANSFTGLTGETDEIDNSGEITVRYSSERQFRMARHIIRLARRQLSKSGQYAELHEIGESGQQLAEMLHLLSPQISIGPWLVLPFVQLLKIVPKK